MNLPKYNVTLWCARADDAGALETSILAKARLEPYESTTYEGIRDFHWGFEDANTATRFAEGLLEYVSIGRVLKLVASSASDEAFGRIVYTDKTKNKK